jgi:predicted nucleic acid-binding protein
VRLTLDSNILINAVDSAAGDRHGIAAALITRAAHGNCVLTLQSLGEFFHVATRKSRLSPADAGLVVERWRAVFSIHAAGEQCLGPAIDLVKRHGFSFWDAMPWTTAREAGCRLLLSEDLQDGQTLGGVTCVNPFAARNRMLIDAALPPIR